MVPTDLLSHPHNIWMVLPQLCLFCQSGFYLLWYLLSRWLSPAKELGWLVVKVHGAQSIPLILF